jgi:hypothetical protein
MIALTIGVLLASALVIFVSIPLVTQSSRRPFAWSRSESGDAESAARPIDALREIEFDRATGKLSDADYAALRATYAPLALAEMRAAGQSLICPECGTASRATGARFCAQCGTSLAA